MKKLILNVLFIIASGLMMGQTGHIMQGIGSVNMSMGGAATGLPVDVSGSLQWNPAGISQFDSKILAIDAGLFFSSPEVSSTAPLPDFSGTISGVTEDDRGTSILPSIGMVFGKADSKHTFGVSAFGISGFGVTFPESMSNPINFPQAMGGFGRVESDYQLLQVGLSYAYEVSTNFSVGIAPTINYAALALEPNPIASPTMAGYPTSEQTSAIGFGFQAGVLYMTDSGFNIGASYKSTQHFSDFEFTSDYLDGTTAEGPAFHMDYPAIYSVGVGYMGDNFDFGLDYRYVDYKNTDGFEASGWTPTASVAGFGWENISIISAGFQYKGIDKLPLRLGYTYSTNPITEELAFFSVPATAVIKNAFQFGLGYMVNSKVTVNTTFHYGTSGGATSGPLYNPMLIQNFPPLGEVPMSNVSYEMTTSMIMFGINYAFTE